MANDSPRRLDVLRDDYAHLSRTLRVNNAFLGYLFQERVISDDEYEELSGDRHTTAEKIRILVTDYLLRGSDDDLDKIIKALRLSEQEHLAERLQSYLDKKNKRGGGGGKRSPEALRVSEQEHLPKRLRSSDKRTQETLSSSPPTSPEDEPDDSGKRSADDVLAKQATKEFERRDKTKIVFPADDDELSKALMMAFSRLGQGYWEEIALHLGLSIAELEQIRKNSNSNIVRLTIVIEQYCRSSEKAPTVGELLMACQQAGIGRHAISKEYARIAQGTETQESLSSSPPTRPEDDVLAKQATDEFLLDLAEKTQSDWQAIAPKLGFRRVEIEAMSDVKEQCIKMLCKWRDREGSAGTLAVLKKAYEEAELVGQFETAFSNFLLTKGMIKVARVRINVIGQDGVGKTCLVRLLLGQNFEDQLSTRGIDMKNAAVTMMQYHCSANELAEEARETSTEWKLLHQEEFRKKLQHYFQKSNSEKKEKKLSHSGPITETKSSRMDGLGDRRELTGPLESSETDDEILGEEVSEISAAPQKDSLTSEQLGFIREIVADPSQVSGLGLDNVILMRICDFGGQEPFLTAHASLMPAGSLSVYLLVFNGALRLTDKAESWHVTEGKGKISQKLVRMKTNDDFLKHWSSSAHIAHPPEEHATFIGEDEDVKYPAIFLVSTHRKTAADEVIEENNRHLKTLLQEKDIRSHFVNTTSSNHMFFLVENTERKDPTANEIRTKVDAMTRKFYERQNVQPARWLKFEVVISLLKTITGRSMGKMSLIREVAQECCIDTTNGENSELERALKHLTHVGSVFYFPEVAVLKDFVFYDADWLINLLASFVGSAHSEPAAPKLKPHWQRAIKSGFLSTDLVNNLLQLAKVSNDEYDAAKGILDYFDIITETKEGSEDKRYVSPCFLQGDFKGQSEYSKAFSSDRKGRLPPPLVLFVEDIVFFPESFFFRLVTRFLRRRRRVYDRLLRRNRMVCPVSPGVDAEFLYQSELNCATLTVFTKNSSLSSEELSKMTKECVSLRMSLAKDIEEAKRRGMAGLQCRLYCQVRERRDENLYDTLAETDDYDITEDVWILANGTEQLSCDERQGMGLWFDARSLAGFPAHNDEVSEPPAVHKKILDLDVPLTQEELIEAEMQIQAVWRYIGRRLGPEPKFEASELHECDQGRCDRDRAQKMLYKWTAKHGSRATRRHLVDAMLKEGCRAQVAKIFPSASKFDV